MIEVVVEAFGGFRAYTFYEALTVNFHVTFDHASGHHKKLIGIGRCATNSKRDKELN